MFNFNYPKFRVVELSSGECVVQTTNGLLGEWFNIHSGADTLDLEKAIQIMQLEVNHYDAIRKEKQEKALKSKIVKIHYPKG